MTRRVIIVGIPGVGKTTIVNRVVQEIEKHGYSLKSIVFGTVMFEEAKKLGIKHRDDMRKLPVGEQQKLQIQAAGTISMINVDFLLVDTHLMVITKEGYWPGLPFEVLKALSPSNLILIEALPHEIISRRIRDTTRHRDPAEENAISKEMEIARGMLNTAAIITGAPILIIVNKENHVEEAVKQILTALGVV